MTETKPFPTAAVLSTITGVLVCEIGEVYEICAWMSGEPVFTHQLPRVGREAQAVLTALRPDLQLAVSEASAVTPENYESWRDIWIARYGAEIEVPRMNADQHENIDPISELAEKAHPDQIIVIATGDTNAD